MTCRNPKSKKPTAFRRAAQRGFTLIELMTVVGMIGIMASIATYRITAGPATTWRVQEAGRDLFNTFVLTHSMARSTGLGAGVFMGSDSCQPNGGDPTVYSYHRGGTAQGMCAVARLPKYCRFGLPNGVGVGPEAPGGNHSIDLGDGISFPQNMVEFDARGYTDPIPNMANDSVYLVCDPNGSPVNNERFGRAIVLRLIGRPKMYEWSPSGKWNPIYMDR